MWDHVQSPATPSYVGYYNLVGQTATTLETGKVPDETCTGTTTNLSCFLPGTPARNGGTQEDSRIDKDTVAPQNQLIQVDGWSPIPNVKVGSVGSGTVSLGWNAAAYAVPAAESGTATNPLLGYILYRWDDIDADGSPNDNICEPPYSEADLGWSIDQFVAKSGGALESATGSFTDTGQDCRFYAIRLVLDGPNLVSSGPDSATGQITGFYKGSSSQGVKINPLASDIFDFKVRYAGKNTMNIAWSSGSESGVTGYYVNRATSPTGPFSRITAEMVPAKGDGSAYSVLDKVSRSLGKTFYYQLQIQKTDGTLSDFASIISASLPKKSTK
jgi:hypothetical protein